MGGGPGAVIKIGVKDVVCWRGKACGFSRIGEIAKACGGPSEQASFRGEELGEIEIRGKCVSEIWDFEMRPGNRLLIFESTSVRNSLSKHPIHAKAVITYE